VIGQGGGRPPSRSARFGRRDDAQPTHHIGGTACSDQHPGRSASNIREGNLAVRASKRSRHRGSYPALGKTLRGPLFVRTAAPFRSAVTQSRWKANKDAGNRNGIPLSGSSESGLFTLPFFGVTIQAVLMVDRDFSSAHHRNFIRHADALAIRGTRPAPSGYRRSSASPPRPRILVKKLFHTEHQAEGTAS